MPANVEATLPLPGLSPASGKLVIAYFDTSALSSDECLLALRKVYVRLGMVKLATWVVALKTRVALLLPSACPIPASSPCAASFRPGRWR